MSQWVEGVSTDHLINLSTVLGFVTFSILFLKLGHNSGRNQFLRGLTHSREVYLVN